MNAPHASFLASPAAAVRVLAGRAAVTAAAVVIIGSQVALAGELLERARQGPLKDHREIVFAVRGVVDDPHWYAHFGRYAPARMGQQPLFPSGASLRALDLATGATRVLLANPPPFDAARDPLDCYAIDQAYWQSFTYQPPTPAQP